MKLGILGGTFNPIHEGHLHVAREFAKLLQLDQVLLIPTHVPPHKRVQQLACGRYRLKMCKLSVEDDPLLKVSSIEIRRRGKSYTVDTLNILCEKFPQAEIFLLMGEDMFLTLDSWYRAQEIIKLAAIGVAPRGGKGEKIKEQKKKLEVQGAKIQICPIDFLPISSTEIRRRICMGESIKGLVPSKVEGYIKRKKLYEE